MTRKNKDDMYIAPKKTKSANPLAEPKNTKAALPLSGFWGVVLLFVALSTLFADWLVYFLTDDQVSLYALVPNIAFWAGLALYKAFK